MEQYSYESRATRFLQIDRNVEMLRVEKIINRPVTSCCYLCFDKDVSDSCLIIDPASEDLNPIDSEIEEYNLLPEYIILTHEHFDHCLSVNEIRKRYPHVKLICSRECNEAIQNEKKNCSVFWNNQKGFTIASADIIVEDVGGKFNWDKYQLKFIPSPGHTRGSISIMCGHHIFTGDAYIPGLRTVTKLPGGNLQQAIQSEKLILRLIDENDLILHSGH